MRQWSPEPHTIALPCVWLLVGLKFLSWNLNQFLHQLLLLLEPQTQRALLLLTFLAAPTMAPPWRTELRAGWYGDGDFELSGSLPPWWMDWCRMQSVEVRWNRYSGTEALGWLSGWSKGLELILNYICRTSLQFLLRLIYVLRGWLLVASKGQEGLSWQHHCCYWRKSSEGGNLGWDLQEEPT